MTIFAIGERFSNADLVVDLHDLGYFPGSVLDVTYGQGRWWKRFRPDVFVGCDLDVERSPFGLSVDFRNLPFDDNSFDTVVFDPPYKLNGTSRDFAGDDSYGVSKYLSVEDRHTMICEGIDECLRVAKTFMILKCQDQVCSGKVRWQTRIFSDWAESIHGVVLVDWLMVRGARAQPPNRSQVHSRRDYSSALVFKKG